MAPLLNAHCQQPGPSRHHLSLDARHSFLMVPSPELQLSFMKQPWRPSVPDQESFVQPFGCHVPSPVPLQPSGSQHHPGPSGFTWLTSSLPTTAHRADFIRVSDVILPQNLHTDLSLTCVSQDPAQRANSNPASRPQEAPLPSRLCLLCCLFSPTLTFLKLCLLFHSILCCCLIFEKVILGQARSSFFLYALLLLL